MIIVDDFLPKDDFKTIQDILLGSEFGWFYNSRIDFPDDKNKFQFTHTLYRFNQPQSSYYNEWYEILVKPITMGSTGSALDKIKVNLLTRTPEIVENKFHTDIRPPKMPFTTSIFYVNTNNGYTKFKNGTIVESVENRLVTFPVNNQHKGSTCTDENIRVVINFNYMNYE